MDNQQLESSDREILKEMVYESILKQMELARCPHCNLPLFLITHKIIADINCPYCNEIIKFDEIL